MSKYYVDVQELKEIIKFKPHPAQIEILMGQEHHRYTTVQCSRKFGKSILGAYIAIKQTFLPKQTVWIVAPTYGITEAMRQYLDPWADLLGFKLQEKKQQIINPATGSKIQFKTADNPKSLLGIDVDLAILDEAAEIDESIFISKIEPNFSNTNGKAIFISTPLGEENWHNQNFLKGQNPKYKNWCSYHFDCWANPYNSKEFLLQRKAELPRSVWEQQYLAIPHSSYGLTFPKVHNIVGSYKSKLAIGGFINRYISAWDIASLNDFSAIGTMDLKTKEVISIEDKFQGDLYGHNGQLEKVLKHCKKNHTSTLYIDSSGGGASMAYQAIRQWMFKRGVFTQPFDLFNTVSKKAEVFQYLINQIEKWSFTIPAHPDTIKQLKENRFKLTSNGVPMYHAPREHHDDFVSMLAMLVYKGLPINYIELKESYNSNTTSFPPVYGRT